MKRDMDLIRAILLYVEDADQGDGFVRLMFPGVEFPDYEFDVLK